ncbi:MAG: hypothetical protein H2056_03425 [Sphingopyxis sp.]|nr:hypothetical protein [Sphingopyxis sp.]
MADPAFREALGQRVANEERFAAFIEGSAYYVTLDQPCPKCDSGKRRVRDRSCYRCHLNQGGENFERMKAGLSPVKKQSRDGYLDTVERARRETAGEHDERVFDGLTARWWPTGRLEVIFPDGHHEHNLIALNHSELENARAEFPMLDQALRWAGWF